MGIPRRCGRASARAGVAPPPASAGRRRASSRRVEDAAPPYRLTDKLLVQRRYAILYSREQARPI
jgi:hypothetical protein